MTPQDAASRLTAHFRAFLGKFIAVGVGGDQYKPRLVVYSKCRIPEPDQVSQWEGYPVEYHWGGWPRIGR